MSGRTFEKFSLAPVEVLSSTLYFPTHHVGHDLHTESETHSVETYVDLRYYRLEVVIKSDMPSPLKHSLVRCLYNHQIAQIKFDAGDSPSPQGPRKAGSSTPETIGAGKAGKLVPC